ncbi:MAG TPA: VWA domain-containing protein [Actinomycetota bacterium]|nr:VWA domain-containing protein [Actinomycetota bacterium]
MSAFRRSKLALLTGLLSTVLTQALFVAPAAADVENGNLPGGTSISVGITNPAEGALYVPGSVPVSGTASIGEGQPVADTTIVYVIDVSGSTQNPGGCGGNQNPTRDPVSNSILDCEIAAGKALNQQAIDAGTVDQVGVVFFDSGASIQDSNPAQAGTQGLVGPADDADGANGRDVEHVMSLAGFGGNTNFEAAVQQACSLIQQSTNTNNIVAFLSDGVATTGGSALDDLPCGPTGATFFTFAIGSGSSCTDTGGGRGSLQQIAEATGGTCTVVANVGSLPDVVPGIIASQLTRLTMTVDSGAPVDISGSANPSLPVEGPASVTFQTTLNNLQPGNHQVCVTATGTDGGGEGSVTDCHNFVVADISLTPEQAVNELGTPGQTHSVTATVAAGSDGGVAGVPVSFNITSGPNAGQAGAANTDANGETQFTYPATQGLAGLGTDQIEACFTDSQGAKDCDTATKQWVDTTPPAAACSPTTNPSGTNVPSAGNNPKSGQNPDGFYVLTVSDAVDPNPTVTIADSGSSATFGPYPAGTKVKLIQAPGATPDVKPGAGDIDYQITLKGDALLTGTDSSGNVSAPLSCNVPPPPK